MVRALTIEAIRIIARKIAKFAGYGKRRGRCAMRKLEELGISPSQWTSTDFIEETNV